MKRRPLNRLALTFIAVVLCACGATKEEKRPLVSQPVQVVLTIPSLALQPPQVLESALGKAVEVDKITNNPEHKPGEYRDYAIRGDQEGGSTAHGLMVRFYKGRAVQFTLDLPTPMDTAEDAILAMGLVITGRPPDTIAPAGTHWRNVTLNGLLFKDVSAQKVGWFGNPQSDIKAAKFDLVQVELIP